MLEAVVLTCSESNQAGLSAPECALNVEAHWEYFSHPLQQAEQHRHMTLTPMHRPLRKAAGDRK